MLDQVVWDVSVADIRAFFSPSRLALALAFSVAIAAPGMGQAPNADALDAETRELLSAVDALAPTADAFLAAIDEENVDDAAAVALLAKVVRGMRPHLDEMLDHYFDRGAERRRTFVLEAWPVIETLLLAAISSPMTVALALESEDASVRADARDILEAVLDVWVAAAEDVPVLSALGEAGTRAAFLAIVDVDVLDNLAAALRTRGTDVGEDEAARGGRARELLVALDLGDFEGLVASGALLEVDGASLIERLDDMLWDNGPAVEAAIATLAKAARSRDSAQLRIAAADALEIFGAAFGRRSAEIAADLRRPAVPPTGFGDEPGEAGDAENAARQDLALQDALRERLSTSHFLVGTQAEALRRELAADVGDPALAQALAALLSEEYSFLARPAAAVLEAMGPMAAPARAALEAHVESGPLGSGVDHAVRALRALEIDLGPMAVRIAEPLTRADGATDPASTLLAVRRLGALGADAVAFLPEIARAAAADHADLRQAAIEAMQQIFDNDIGSSLRGALDNHFVTETDARDRLAAVLRPRVLSGAASSIELTLFRRADVELSSAVQGLIARALDEAAPPDAQVAALAAVSTFPMEEETARTVARLIVAHLLDPGLDPDLVVRAGEALARFGVARTADPEALANLLRSSDPARRIHAANAIANRPDATPSQVEALAAALATSSGRAEMRAMLAALAAAEEAATPAANQIADLLLSGVAEESGVEFDAGAALRRLGPGAASQQARLVAAVVDPSRPGPVRSAAAKALGGLGEAATGATLDALFATAATDPAARTWALSALAAIAPPDQRAFDTFAELAGTLEGYQRTSATEVLARIVEAAEGAQKRIWARDAAAVLLDLPPSDSERQLLEILEALQADARAVFDRAVAHLQRQAAAYEALDPPTEAAHGRRFDAAVWDVRSAIDAVVSLAVKGLPNEDRRTVALDALRNLIDSRSVEIAGKAMEAAASLGPFTGANRDDLQVDLERQLHAGDDRWHSAAEAFAVLATANPEVWPSIVELADPARAVGTVDAERARRLLEKLGQAQEEVIVGVSDRLVDLYLTPDRAGDDATIDYRDPRDAVPGVLVAGGLGSMPAFLRLAREAPEVDRILDELERFAIQIQKEFEPLNASELGRVADQIGTLADAVRAHEVNSFLVERQESVLELLEVSRRAAEDNRDRKNRLWWKWFGELMSNPWVWFFGGYGAFIVVAGVVSFAAPLATLRLYGRLRSVINGRYSPFGVIDILLLLRFIVYSDRTLNAWVREMLRCVTLDGTDCFAASETVRRRRDFNPLPIDLEVGGATVPLVDAPLLSLLARLRDLFSAPVARVQIIGGGGRGKTSLAVQIALAARAPGALATHPMLPVLVETDFDDLAVAVSGEIKETFLLEEQPDAHLLDTLLRRRRLLVIVDHLSEMENSSRDAFRRGVRKRDINALIVTSRTEIAGPEVQATIIPQLISDVPALSSFLKSVLSSWCVADGGDETPLRAIDLVEESLIADACGYILRMTAPDHAPSADAMTEGRPTSGVTPLLASTFAALIARQAFAQRGRSSKLARLDTSVIGANVPEMFLEHVRTLHVRDDPPSDVVTRELRRIAWATVEDALAPRDIGVEVLRDRLAAEGLEVEGLERRLGYYAGQMEVLRPAAPTTSVGFVNDPVAEHLAAVHVVEQFRDDDKRWDALMSRVRKVDGAVPDFVMALARALQAFGEQNGVDEETIGEAARMSGLKPARRKIVEPELASPTPN